MPAPALSVLEDTNNSRTTLSLTLQDVHGESAAVTIGVDYIPFDATIPVATIRTQAATLAKAIADKSNASLVAWSLTTGAEIPPAARASPTSAEYATTGTVANIRLTSNAGGSYSPFDVVFSVPAPAQAIFGPLGTEDVIPITTGGDFGTVAAEEIREAVNVWLAATFNVATAPAPPTAPEDASATRGTIGSRKAKFGRRPRYGVAVSA